MGFSSNKYKDLFIKDNYVYIKGYLNSYTDKDNKIITYVRVTSISNNELDIIKGERQPHIRHDIDDTLVWNGIRCEKRKWDFNNPEDVEKYKELEEIIKEFK